MRRRNAVTTRFIGRNPFGIRINTRINKLKTMSLLTYFKYKIIEFAPDENMEKTFKKLGEDGWELVSVVPIGLKIKAYFKMTL